MLTIKPVGLESAKLLSELCTSTFIQAYSDIHSQENLDAYCKENYSEKTIREILSSNDTESVIAYSDSQPSGFYVIKQHACPIPLAGQITELKQIYILANQYRRGLGYQLFQNTVERAKSNGSQWLWLCVSDVNYRAQAFYAKLGLTRIGQGPVLVVGTNKLTSSIMTLELD